VRGPKIGYPLLFLLPTIIIVFGVLGAPAIYSFSQSFYKISFLGAETTGFVGIENYIKAINDPRIYDILYNTIFFTILSVVLTFSLSLLLAFLLNEEFRGRTIARALILLPWAISGVGNGTMWKTLFNYHGVINEGVIALGFPRMPWLADPPLIRFVLILAQSYLLVPFCTFVILAGLQEIPKNLIESTKIDGASALQRLRHLTFPMLKPALMSALLVSTIVCIKVFDIMYVITAGGGITGGAIGPTRVIYYYGYEQIFVFFRVGYGLSIIWILCAIVFVFSVVYYTATYSKEIVQ